MLFKNQNVPKFEESCPMGGKGELTLDKPSSLGCLPAGSVATFARATLAPGAEVGFHIHKGDSEAYYFLSGEGEYDDGGVTYKVSAGDFSYTADGEGHGVKNVGDEPLVFIALIFKS